MIMDDILKKIKYISTFKNNITMHKVQSYMSIPTFKTFIFYLANIILEFFSVLSLREFVLA